LLDCRDRAGAGFHRSPIIAIIRKPARQHVCPAHGDVWRRAEGRDNNRHVLETPVVERLLCRGQRRIKIVFHVEHEPLHLTGDAYGAIRRRANTEVGHTAVVDVGIIACDHVDWRIGDKIVWRSRVSRQEIVRVQQPRFVDRGSGQRPTSERHDDARFVQVHGILIRQSAASPMRDARLLPVVAYVRAANALKRLAHGVLDRICALRPASQRGLPAKDRRLAIVGVEFQRSRAKRVTKIEIVLGVGAAANADRSACRAADGFNLRHRGVGIAYGTVASCIVARGRNVIVERRAVVGPEGAVGYGKRRRTTTSNGQRHEADTGADAVQTAETVSPTHYYLNPTVAITSILAPVPAVRYGRIRSGSVEIECIKEAPLVCVIAVPVSSFKAVHVVPLSLLP